VLAQHGWRVAVSLGHSFGAKEEKSKINQLQCKPVTSLYKVAYSGVSRSVTCFASREYTGVVTILKALFTETIPIRGDHAGAVLR